MSKIKLVHSSGNSMSIEAPATNPASDLAIKLPATIGTAGQVLKNSSTAGTLEFGTSAGITMADQWRQSTWHTTNDSENFLTSDWEQVDTSGMGTLGTAMSQSSGIFTFPETGIYFVTWNAYGEDAGESNVMSCDIQVTVNNSDYNTRASAVFGIDEDPSGYSYKGGHCEALVDVTDTSNVKVRFRVYSNSSVTWDGNTSANRMHATFIRMGDT